MFEYNGKEYELKFNLERLKLIENAINASFVSKMTSTNGALPISDIETCFKYCLKETGSDVFVPAKEAISIAEKLLKTKGYLYVDNLIIEKMAKDIPFLFQSA